MTTEKRENGSGDVRGRTAMVAERDRKVAGRFGNFGYDTKMTRIRI